MRKNIKKITDIDDLEEVISLPSCLQADIEKMNKYNEDEVITDDRDNEAIMIAAIGNRSTLNSGIQDNVDNETYENGKQADGKKFGVTSISFKNKRVSSRVRLGITTPVKVVLYNSGFMYVTNEVGMSEENELMLSISEAYKSIAIKTAGFSFSSDSLFYDDEVLNFILGLIETGGWTNLTGMKDDEIIWDHVSIFDLPIIYLGLVKAINPSVFKISNVCTNVTKLKDTTPIKPATGEGTTNPEVKQPSDTAIETFDTATSCDGDTATHTKNIKCNTIITADVVPDTLLHVNNMCDLTLIRKPTVTPSDLITYKSNIGIVPVTITVVVNGKNIKVTINDPSISRYIEISNIVLSGVEESVNNVISEENNDYKRLKMAELFDKDDLLKYVHFVESITYEDGVTITSGEEIIEAVQSFSKFEDTKIVIMDAVKDYITSKSVAIVGIEEYICDKCNATVEGSEHDGFRNIIPINMQQFFFDLFKSKLM